MSDEDPESQIRQNHRKDYLESVLLSFDPMKLMIVTGGYPRSKGDFANVYLHRMAVSLVDEDVAVHVVAPHASRLEKEENMDGVNVHRFYYAYPKSLETLAYFPGIPEKIRTLKGKVILPFFVTGMALSMLRIVRSARVNLVNAHWATPSGAIAVALKGIHRKPVVITIYGAELWPILKKRKGIVSYLTRYALRRADRVVAISDATATAASEIAGLNDTIILPDGIDVRKFSPEIDTTGIREKYRVGDGPLIFSSGRMVRRKGFEYLVVAFSVILRQFPTAILLIGGDGPERQDIELKIQELGIQENVRLPGFIEELDFPKLMRACDIFILPSIVDENEDTEGSATILLEAMACATPVIGTRVGGIPYAVKDGIGGLLVNEKSPEEMAEAILRLLGDKNVRDVMGVAGAEYVRGHFSSQATARRYLQIFKEVLENQYGQESLGDNSQGVV